MATLCAPELRFARSEYRAHALQAPSASPKLAQKVRIGAKAHCDDASLPNHSRAAWFPARAPVRSAFRARLSRMARRECIGGKVGTYDARGSARRPAGLESTQSRLRGHHCARSKSSGRLQPGRRRHRPVRGGWSAARTSDSASARWSWDRSITDPEPRISLAPTDHTPPAARAARPGASALPPRDR